MDHADQAGGQILTPWGTEYSNGALARLTVCDGSGALGRFDSLTLAFMRLRAQRTGTCPWNGDGPGTPDLTRTVLTSEQIYDLIAAPGAFVVGLRMPDCHKLVDEDDLIVRLHDPRTMIQSGRRSAPPCSAIHSPRPASPTPPTPKIIYPREFPMSPGRSGAG